MSNFFVKQVEFLYFIKSDTKSRSFLTGAAQGFAVRRTLVRRSRQPAENADQGKKGHLWMDTIQHFPCMLHRRLSYFFAPQHPGNFINAFRNT